MRNALNRVRAAIVYLGYLAFFCVFSTILASSFPGWTLEIDAASLVPLERDLLHLFSRAMNFLDPSNAFMVAMALLAFTLVSFGKTKIPLLVTAIQFFVFFFGTYFFTKFMPDFLPARTADIAWTIVVFIVIDVACTLLPSMLIKKIARKRKQDKQMATVIPNVFYTCKTCGATFKSNAKLCSNCLSSLEE